MKYIPLVYLFFMSFIVPLISDHCTVDCRLATRSLHYIKSNRNQILLWSTFSLQYYLFRKKLKTVNEEVSWKWAPKIERQKLIKLPKTGII